MRLDFKLKINMLNQWTAAYLWLRETFSFSPCLHWVYSQVQRHCHIWSLASGFCDPITIGQLLPHLFACGIYMCLTQITCHPISPPHTSCGQRTHSLRTLWRRSCKVSKPLPRGGLCDWISIAFGLFVRSHFLCFWWPDHKNHLKLPHDYNIHTTPQFRRNILKQLQSTFPRNVSK